MASTPKKTLADRLALVMGEVKRLAKTGYNDHFKYEFATDGDVSDLIRTLLSEQGVAFLPSIERIERDAVPGRNGEQLRVTVYFSMEFRAGDEVFECNWVGEALDNQDKAVSKAATSGVKYFLLKTFLISTGEAPAIVDPDSGPAPPTEEERKAAEEQRREDTIRWDRVKEKSRVALKEAQTEDDVQIVKDYWDELDRADQWADLETEYQLAVGRVSSPAAQETPPDDDIPF